MQISHSLVTDKKWICEKRKVACELSKLYKYFVHMEVKKCRQHRIFCLILLVIGSVSWLPNRQQTNKQTEKYCTISSISFFMFAEENEKCFYWIVLHRLDMDRGEWKIWEICTFQRNQTQSRSCTTKKPATHWASDTTTLIWLSKFKIPKKKSSESSFINAEAHRINGIKNASSWGFRKKTFQYHLNDRKTLPLTLCLVLCR